MNSVSTGSVTITGTAEEDQTLTASNTLADEDGIGAISYQWLRDGSAISGATGTSYTLTQDDVGAEISVRASYTDGQGTAETITSSATAPVTNVNDAPTGAVTITGTAEEDETLTAANTLADQDGLGAVSYQWLRDGSAISGATGASYTLSQDDVGAAISVRASYTDGQGTAESVTSSATAAVTNVNDAPTGTVTISGTPTEDETLTASNTLADEDGLGAVSYQWLRDGSAISGATGASYTLSQDDVGDAISVRASYTDGQGTAESVTSSATAPVTNVNDAPTGSVTITGTAAEDETLTAANTLADADGLGAVSYQWLRDGSAISGATGTSYTLTQEDVGAAISVRASYTDEQGTVETVASSATATVTNVNDAPTGTVSITGTATEDETLTAANTLADEDGIGAISYQWLRDGSAISGATGASYTLSQDDVGAEISVRASYTDGQGTAETVTSSATATVTNVNDAPTGSVTITGTATEDETLTAANTLADEDGIGVISYQWLRDGSAISGATGTSYTLSQADVGAAISVRASYTDGQGTAESVTSDPTTTVTTGELFLRGSIHPERLVGGSGNDQVEGGDGEDTIDGGDGDDILSGGISENSGNDLIFSGAGDDMAAGGHGEDLIFGMSGDDTLNGGFGNDELRGQTGNDVISGNAGADLLVGGDGEDFLNGGYGNDRLHGGSGADRFFHLGLDGHGTDWIKDFSAQDGDTLVFGIPGAHAEDFVVTFDHVESDRTGRPGDDSVEEAFITYSPTGQVVWVLVDGSGQDEILLQPVGSDAFDLLA